MKLRNLLIAAAMLACSTVQALTPTFTPTPTWTPTITKTTTSTWSPTTSPTPTWSPTKTNTQTITNTFTFSPTLTRTNTFTFSPTTTPTPTFTATRTWTQTATKTPTSTWSPTATPTLTITKTPTQTPSPTLTQSQTYTNSPTPSITPSVTKTMTQTNTPSPTLTSTPSFTPAIVNITADTSTQGQVTVSWQTLNLGPTGATVAKVNYGTTTSYGLSRYGSYNVSTAYYSVIVPQNGPFHYQCYVSNVNGTIASSDQTMGTPTPVPTSTVTPPPSWTSNDYEQSLTFIGGATTYDLTLSRPIKNDLAIVCYYIIDTTSNTLVTIPMLTPANGPTYVAAGNLGMYVTTTTNLRISDTGLALVSGDHYAMVINYLF